MKRFIPMAAILMVFALVITACGGKSNNGSASQSDGNGGSGDKVKIVFFQNKTEAKPTYDKLIQKFQTENPNISVQQLNPPEAETALKVRVSTNDIPDVMGLGANATFAELAQKGVFADFASSPDLGNIQPAYVDMLKRLTGGPALNGIPYSANANGVLYNKDIFTKLGITPPKTWDEFVAAAQKAKDANITPFYFTFKDAWTSLPLWNALASNLGSPTFFEDRKAGKTTFKDSYKEVVDKNLQIVKNFSHKDAAGKGYDDGNTAFAKGQSAMLIQGVWAIPNILKANPNMKIGSFVLPTSNDPTKNKLVSGVDVVLTMAKQSKHAAEAQKFIDFLLKPENAKVFIDDQKAFSAVKGVVQEDPNVAELKPAFDNGQLVDFFDHYVPSAVKLENLVQELDMKQDPQAFLTKLDKEWDKVQARK